MANTFTQIHIHTVFAVHNRESAIEKSWRDDLYKYLIAIIQNHGHKVLSIGGMTDHVHILFGMRPTQSLSDLMQQTKRDSSEWINRTGFTAGKFSWQEGYGAFSYGKSQVPAVINYISKQEQHHAKISFADEFKKILDAFGLAYDEKFVFHKI